MEKKWIAISVILAVICACVVMSVPMIKVTYTVKEPYTTTETYYVTEPYIDRVPLSYETFGLVCHDRLRSDEIVLDIPLRNTDDTGGGFWVTFYAVGTKGSHASVTKSVFLLPGESHIFNATFSLGACLPNSAGCSYEIHQTTKEVTRYHDVPKERTVTKYSDITKYKYISAFEHLLQEKA